MDETSEDFLFWCGEKIRSEGQMEGVWTNKHYSGRFIARYDVYKYPEIVFRFDGQDKYQKDGERPKKIRQFERRVTNAKHELFLGELTEEEMFKKTNRIPKKPKKYVDPDEFCFGALNKRDGNCCNLAKILISTPFLPLFM